MIDDHILEIAPYCYIETSHTHSHTVVNFIRGTRTVGFSLAPNHVRDLISALLDNSPPAPILPRDYIEIGQPVTEASEGEKTHDKAMEKYYAEKKPGEYTGD